MLSRPFMRSLNMPNLANLAVSVELRYVDLVRIPGGSAILQDFVPALLPDPVAHSNLTSLSIKLTDTDRPDWSDFEFFEFVDNDPVYRMVLVIPLDMIPKVSSLSVQSFIDFKFSRPSTAESAGDCALRELHVHDSSILIFSTIIDSLKNLNALDTLESFKVERCGDFRNYADDLPEHLK